MTYMVPNVIGNQGRKLNPDAGLKKMIMRILPDTCIYDKIIASPHLYDHIRELIRSKRIEIVQPHIITSQLEQAPESKREKLLSIPARVIPVDGFLTGHSGAGDRVGDGSGGIKIDDIMKKKQPHEEDKKPTPGNIHDALIATTAAMEADVLVTEDRRLRNRAKLVKPTMHVWNFADLESYLTNF
jgi:hypothetical protein